jgi:anti-sigma factor RsiW
VSEETIREDELQAWVDGRLDDARRAQVEQYLAANPQEAQRLADYRRQNELLHALFEPVAAEPAPRRLRARMPRRWLAPLRYGAMAASLALAAVFGWFLRGVQEPLVVAETLPRQAAIAHVVYAPEVQHPVEVDAAQEEHLVKWLSKRLDLPVRAPQLGSAGFELVGGRLLPGADRPAAQFMYQDAAGGRVTLYVSADGGENRETAFRYAREGNVSVFYWVDGRVGYALSGEVERDKLLAVAEAVYHDLNR